MGVDPGEKYYGFISVSLNSAPACDAGTSEISYKVDFSTEYNIQNGSCKDGTPGMSTRDVIRTCQ